MKSVSQLAAVLVLSTVAVGVGALVGCAAPTIPGSTLDDPNASDSAQTAKLPASNNKKTSPATSGDTSTPAPSSAPTTPPAPSSSTPPTPAPVPSTDPEACMNQCAATGPAAQYWTCSASCQDQQCDDNCWNPTCGQNAQACESALDACATQCGLNVGP